MTNPDKQKAPDAAVAKQDREEGNRNTYQGDPMDTSLPRIPAHFETTIRVAGLTVAPGELTGGNQPDEAVVTLITREETISLAPAEACALAAALQAVAVHLMENTPRELRRNTEPGNPAFEEEV